jgi:holin-like protein
MKNILYTVLSISFCLLLGKLVNFSIGGLPGSLYGMVFYCLLLQLGWMNPDKVKRTNLWIIRSMGICLVPAAVGVMNHFELLKHHGFTIVISVIFTTFVLLSFVGLMAERYLAPSAKN